MNASPISLSSAAPAHEPSAAKQSDGDSAGESFSQALTREISERHDTSQASAPSRPAGAADQKAADKAAKTEKKAEKDQSADEKDKDAEKDKTADAAGSAGMLAFMIDAHQLSGKSIPAEKADAGKSIGASTGTAGKTLPLKPGATAAAAVDEKIAGAHDQKKKTSDTTDTQAASKAKDFAENLREAGKDARQAHGETAKADAKATGAQIAAEARVEILHKNALEHERALELHAAPAASAGLMPAQQAASLSAAGTAAAASALSPQLGTPAWDQALGQNIVWMVAGGQQSASLTLNPPDLGPLQVVLNVSNSMADATFITAQPEVRHALEQAMPKLREMMGAAGIQLGQANVNTGTPNGNHAPRDNFPAQIRAAATGAEASSDAPALVVRSRPIIAGQGLVDTFV